MTDYASEKGEIKVHVHRYSKKSEKLFSLLDQLQQQANVEIHDPVVFDKRHKLDAVEKGAIETERIAQEMQILVQSMRRK